jgi:hypothetical protein
MLKAILSRCGGILFCKKIIQHCLHRALPLDLTCLTSSTQSVLS